MSTMTTQQDSLMLSEDELRELTGYRQPKRMAEWLTERGWVFEPGRRSQPPKVDRAYYLARMSGKAATPRRPAPRLDFLLQP